MTPTLLPCPHCGSEKAPTAVSFGAWANYVMCQQPEGCGISTRSVRTPAEAIARWNRRAGEDALAVAERNIELSRESWLRIKDERDALREALERIANADRTYPDKKIADDMQYCARAALRGKP